MNNTTKTKFAMAFHCYQPAFNFEGEIENAFKKAYSPLLSTLESFPGIKASFHFSGNMLEWFHEKHPEYVEKINKLLKRGQIELIGGAYCDPVMALIPERDRLEQLKMNNGIIERLFAIKPEGAWIAERLWQSSLVETLSSADIKYTILDDHHFLTAGLEEDKIHAPYSISSKKGALTLFPALTRLRYTMPFSSPKITMKYIRKRAHEKEEEQRCFFFADDGEKFGAWPHTYRHVYEKGWLKKFFILLEENSDWLQSSTYSEVMNEVSHKNVDALPETSYAEMEAWSGGDFKNFLDKYPEADRMHKRMMSVSDMINRAVSIDESKMHKEGWVRKAKRELFKAQSGCAYWHGTFGGLYLPHLRQGVYKHLIKARKIITDAMGKQNIRVWAVEHDLGDKTRESVISNKFIDIFVKSSSGGAINEMDYKTFNVNVVNTLSRVKEDYHKKLKRGYSSKIRRARKEAFRGRKADIHDILGVSEKGLKRVLAYDNYQRGVFLTHILKNNKSWKDMNKPGASYGTFLKKAYAPATEYGRDFISHVLTRRDKVKFGDKTLEIEVIKEIKLGGGKDLTFFHRIKRHSKEDVKLRYAVEFNFLIWDKDLMKKPKCKKTDKLLLADMYSGLSMDFSMDRKLTVLTYPIYAVNETEKGLGKTFQGIAVLIGEEDTKGESEMKISLSIR